MIRSDDLARTAHAAADAAAREAGVRVVPLDALTDAGRVNAVIDHVWGEQHIHADLLRALEFAGALLLGASEAEPERVAPAGDGATAGGLVGYTFAFVGFDRHAAHLHSHMTAVLPEWAGRGVGRALKLAQRAEALDRGIGEVRWTYDPLLARNAWFNLVRLGALGVRFLPEFYGHMTDKQNAGDRSDRFEVRWRLTSSRVGRALARDGCGPRPAGARWVLRAAGDGADAKPEETGIDVEPGTRALVAIPSDHQALRSRDPGLARAWREASVRAFDACFASGLVATSIDRQAVYRFEPAPVDAAAAADDGAAV